MRRYEGKGILSFPGISDIDGKFEIRFQDNGKTTLTFITSEGDFKTVIDITNVDSPGKFKGESDNSKYFVYIDKIYFGILHMPEKQFEFDITYPVKVIYNTIQGDDEIRLIRGLSNFIFWGTEATQRGQTWRRDTIRASLVGTEIQLIHIEDFENVEKHLVNNRDIRITCEIKLVGYYKDITSIREMVEDVQFLSSLATGNYVTSIYEDIYNNNVLSETMLFPLKTYPYSNFPKLIDTSLHGSSELKEYLETTYPRYVQVKVPLGLPYVIELFTTSKIYSPMELEYLLTTTTLECLERYFRIWKKLPRMTLKEKTRRLLEFFRVPYSENEIGFGENRNSIVHEGRFPPNIDKLKTLLELRNLMDRLFLGILEYHGKPYYNIIQNRKEIL